MVKLKAEKSDEAVTEGAQRENSLWTSKTRTDLPRRRSRLNRPNTSS